MIRAMMVLDQELTQVADYEPTTHADYLAVTGVLDQQALKLKYFL